MDRDVRKEFFQGSIAIASFGKRSSQGDAGGFVKVKESYARKDVDLPETWKDGSLVIVPTASTLDVHLETLLSCGKVCDRVLILGSVVSRLKFLGHRNTLRKIENVIKLDADRNWKGLADENCLTIPLPRNTTSTINWLAAKSSLKFVVVSENVEFRYQIQTDNASKVKIICMIDLIQEICNPLVSSVSAEDYSRILDIAYSADAVSSMSTKSVDPPICSLGSNSSVTKQGRLRCVGPRIAFVGDDAVIISSDDRNRAIHDDIVEIEPIAAVISVDVEHDEEIETKKRRPYRVVRIIQASSRRRQLVVTLDAVEVENISSSLSSSEGRKLMCIPMDDRYPKLRIYTRLGRALIGKRFIAEIMDWPVDSKWPDGKYIQTIGTAFELTTESSALLVETELQAHENPFPASALAELPLANTLEVNTSNGEIDLRDRKVVSIDPIGCQDIDDAMSLEKQPDGTYELGVHIADVARFVKIGSSLDKEASSRATSVYLQERRLDMLPAILCENLCSLRPNLDRYAVSAIFQVDRDLNVDLNSAKFRRSAIHSRYALAYEQAQKLADNEDPGECMRGGWTGGPVDVTDHTWLKESITFLMVIARKRQMHRKKQGAVALESETEFKFSLDAAANPTAVTGSSHLEIHDTVAELMILANAAAAEYILKTAPSLALLRCHPPADSSRFRACIDYVKQIGLEFDASNSKTIAASLERVRQHTDQASAKWIEQLAARAMAEAQYVCAGAIASSTATQSPFFHFGLGLEYYTHFTSPIRRYADVIVARLLLLEYDNKKELVEGSIQETETMAVAKRSDENVDVSAHVEKQLSDLPEEEEDLSWANALGGNGSDDDDDGEDHVKSNNLKGNTDDDDAVEDVLNWVTGSKPKPVNSFELFSSVEKTGSFVPAKINTSDVSDKAKLMDEEIDTSKVVPKNDVVYTAQSIQAFCDHINFRHRSAKDASMRSQDLFFSLYFSATVSRMTHALAIVYALTKDGIRCFVPEYSLKVAIPLVRYGKLLKNSLSFEDDDDDVNSNWSVSITDKLINLRSGENIVSSISLMSEVHLVLFCNLKDPDVAPAPRVPNVEGKLVLNRNAMPNRESARQSIFVNKGKDSVRSKVMDDQMVKAVPMNNASSSRRLSLYCKLFSEKQKQKTPSNRGKFATSNAKPIFRIVLGGYQPKRQRPVTSIYEEEEESEENVPVRYVQSASSLTKSQMIKMEREAMSRVAKLQAEKYDSRVKRRMKKE